METYQLYLIVPPGLEDLAAREITRKMGADEMLVGKGGIELNADLEWIKKAHLLLKLPTRILMRLTHFKVRDFPKLYQKFTQFSWNKFLSHPEPFFEISCSKSRLNHTGKIEETVRAALMEAQKKQPLSLDWQKKNYPPQTFYIRLVDDLLTLSLDLTGEALYKRGYQVIKGEAPIRENLASAFLMELFEGITTPMQLVDPMCGSATFLTEAMNFTTPLHLRPFAFETAPFFKGQNMKLPKTAESLPIQECWGFDINSELIRKVSAVLPHVHLHTLDSIQAPLPVKGEMLMICNPPYGERIQIKGKRGSFLKGAWEKFLTADKPLRFGWILPSDMDDLFETPSGYRSLSKRHLKNGGLAVTFWLWERQGQ